ncbi:MAG: Mur ligase domain-containing protein, partial [Candidatus Nucleicultricaceae bacterium]
MKSPLWSSDAVIDATGGLSHHAWAATGFSIDSRTIEPGDLFLALKGPIFDGHDYVEEAIKKGAVAAIVHQDYASDLPVVRVEDTFEAL